MHTDPFAHGVRSRNVLSVSHHLAQKMQISQYDCPTFFPLPQHSEMKEKPMLSCIKHGGAGIRKLHTVAPDRLFSSSMDCISGAPPFLCNHPAIIPKQLACLHLTAFCL